MENNRPDVKLCECGCGQPTSIIKETNRPRGHIKGEYCRYIKGHTFLGAKREKSSNWNGGKNVFCGYSATLMPDHPRAFKNGYVADHILVAEEVLGQPLPLNAVVHHVDGDKSNNQKNNLVICESENYHRLLHKRIRAYKACGHANWLKCAYCGEYDDPQKLYVCKSSVFHRQCRNKYNHNKCKPVKVED